MTRSPTIAVRSSARLRWPKCITTSASCSRARASWPVPKKPRRSAAAQALVGAGLSGAGPPLFPASAIRRRRALVRPRSHACARIGRGLVQPGDLARPAAALGRRVAAAQGSARTRTGERGHLVRAARTSAAVSARRGSLRRFSPLRGERGTFGAHRRRRAAVGTNRSRIPITRTKYLPLALDWPYQAGKARTRPSRCAQAQYFDVTRDATVARLPGA